MSDTIDIEASRNRKLITDIDKHRRWYKLTEGDTVVNFVSPTISTYEKFKFFILRNSSLRKLEQKYFFRPDYFSYDEYGTTTLWTLILFINDIPSIEDFTKLEILVPSYSAILELARNNELSSPILDVNEMNKEPTYVKDITLYSSKVSPTLVDLTAEIAETTSEEDMNYIRQRFILTNISIANQFVDLGYVPIPESIDIKIAGLTLETIYDWHYTMTEDPSDDLRRLSWSDDDCPLGEGMTDILAVGMTLEVQYVKDDSANA